MDSTELKSIQAPIKDRRPFGYLIGTFLSMSVREPNLGKDSPEPLRLVPTGMAP